MANKGIIYKESYPIKKSEIDTKINGEPVKFRRHDHNKQAFPFLDAKFARDSKTLSFKFRHVIKDDYKIELIVKEK